MTEAQHTPGPWEAHQGIDANEPKVWDVTSKHDWKGSAGLTPKGWFVATVHEVRCEDDAEANAHLIAAAPELLAAHDPDLLEDMADDLDRGASLSRQSEIADDLRELVATIRAAIAKAKGAAA